MQPTGKPGNEVRVQRYLGIVYMVAAAFLWAFIGPLSRYCLQNGISPAEIAFWRVTIASVLFLTHARFQGGQCVRSRSDALAFLLFGGLGIGALFVLVFTVVEQGGAALASVMLYTAPAWVALFSHIFFHEPLTRRKIAAVGLCLAGVVGISFSGGGTGQGFSPLVVGMGLVTGILYASHYMFTKKFLARYSPMMLYGQAMGVAAICLFPFVTFAHKTSVDWFFLLALAFFCSYLGYFVYCLGIERMQPTKAAILATLEPCFATFVAWWWWGELFTPLGWLGAGLVLVAVLVQVKPEHTREATGKQESAHTVQ